MGIDKLLNKIKSRWIFRREFVIPFLRGLLTNRAKNDIISLDGGAGSGNHNHAGVKGQRGGSAPSSSSSISAAATQSANNANATLKNWLASGKVSKAVDKKKQSKHIAGSAAYKKAVAAGKTPSTISLTPAQQQAIINNAVKHGTAIVIPDGSIRIKYKNSSPIGTYVSKGGTTTAQTNNCQIHFSKSGAHIVPDVP